MSGRLGGTGMLLLLGTGACANFHVVEEGRVYRCSQPSAGQLTYYIAEHDIKTVLRLRGGSPGHPGYDEEKGAVDRAGITLAQVPMSARFFPSADTLLALWRTLETAEYPILMHCMAGADRTGLAAALYKLQTTGDLYEARQQLCILYGHVGAIGGTGELDEVLEMYAPFHGKVSFPDWVVQHYRPPTE